MKCSYSTFHVYIFLLIQLTLTLNNVNCSPYEAYPINKQLPPIARVNEGFTFTISNDTYKSTIDKYTTISYNAYNLPGWLSFDAGSRTFHGTPPSSFVGDSADNTKYFQFILEGVDTSDQNSLNNTYELIVSTKSSISVAENFNLLAFLKNYGNTNGKDALILSPYEIFNVTFDRSSFTNSNSIKAIYGRTKQYNAPLPNWLFFDPNTLKFSGTAPTVNSVIAPELFYQFSLIATDIEGFSGIDIPFQLVIGAHQLTTSIQNTILINVTESGSFTYQLPLSYVYFDGKPITHSNLGAMNLEDAPSWVTLANDTITGKLDNQSTTDNFSVAIYDNFGDVVYLNMEVISTTNLFATPSLPNINATRDEWFQYNFLPSQFTDYEKTDISVTYPNSSQSSNWLNFQSSNLTLSGKVPSDFDSLKVGLVAKQDTQSQELDFQIIGMGKKFTTNSTNSTRSSISSSSTTSISSETSSSSSSTTTSTSSGTPVATTNKSHSNHKKTVAIACGVVIPVIVIGALLILLLVLWRRRRNSKDIGDDDGTNDKEMTPAPNGPTSRNQRNTITAMHNPFDRDEENAGLSSDSSSSVVNEKFHTLEGTNADKEDVFADEFESRSQENLLSAQDNNKSDPAFYNPYNRSSSFYMDAEPINEKSWRYNNSTGTMKNNRESAMSLNTVSTADLFNTEIKDDEALPKDPKKSSLGTRDSVFLGNRKSAGSSTMDPRSRLLPPLEEHEGLPELSNNEGDVPHSKSFGTESNSSNDDFVPVKKGNDYKWVHSNEPNRKPSQKRFVNLTTAGTVDIGQAADIEGQVPEML